MPDAGNRDAMSLTGASLDEQRLRAISARLLTLLEACLDQGLGEYELLTALRSARVAPFTDLSFSDNLTLFRAHFVLYHVLYRLREELCARQTYHLEITPLKIRLLPFVHSADAALAAQDPLRAYYGDLRQLATVTEADVRELLLAFWRDFAQSSQRRDALQVLGLEADADAATVRRRYRELAMRHHPDRGGDKEKLQELNAAIKVLRRRRKT